MVKMIIPGLEMQLKWVNIEDVLSLPIHRKILLAELLIFHQGIYDE